MGNSTGNLFKFWDAIRDNKRMIGAFIWDWMDQGLVKTTDDGEEYWAYGGDFGDTAINSQNFCLNGIINADQTPKPATWEVKKVFEPVEMSPINPEKGLFTVENHHNFLNLSRYQISWEITEEGNIIHEETIPSLDVAPGKSSDIQLTIQKPGIQKGKEYFITFRYKLKEDTQWAKAGHEVAWQQFELPWEVPAPLLADASDKPLKVQESENGITINGEAFQLTIDKKSGLLNSYIKSGKEYLLSPLKPNFWRPLTDNDRRGAQAHVYQIAWKTAADEIDVKKMIVTESDKIIKVAAELWLTNINSAYSIDYTVYPDGSLKVDAAIRAAEGLPEMLRFGMQTRMPSELDQWTWFGKGPHENYWDRQRGASIGLYSVSVENDFFHYAYPQESNNRTEIRWFTLKNKHGAGLIVKGVNPLSVSAWPYTQQEIARATHTHELTPGDITVNIDHKQAGVGGDDSWSMGAKPHKEFRLPAGNYQYSFIISFN
jgi:beta-galactosidase